MYIMYLPAFATPLIPRAEARRNFVNRWTGGTFAVRRRLPSRSPVLDERDSATAL